VWEKDGALPLRGLLMDMTGNKNRPFLDPIRSKGTVVGRGLSVLEARKSRSLWRCGHPCPWEKDGCSSKSGFVPSPWAMANIPDAPKNGLKELRPLITLQATAGSGGKTPSRSQREQGAGTEGLMVAPTTAA
jgi:hypothetical protein